MRAISPGALLTVYLVATTLLLVAGRDRVLPGGLAVHLAVLAAIACATWYSRVPRWLRAWAPLLSLLFLYSELPMLIRAAGHDRFFDATVMGWEAALFGGQPAMEWAARWPAAAISETLHAGYLAYYPIIYGVPAVLWLRRRRDDFAEAVFVVMLTFVLCYACFIAFPVEGPRYAWRSAADEGPIRAFTLWLLDARSSRGSAFPSSHVAVATAQSLLAWRYFGPRGIPVALATLALSLGAVYGGFHYAVDVVAGAALGAVTTVLGLAVCGLLDRRDAQAKATAPTNPVAAPSFSPPKRSSSGTASTPST